VLKHIEDNGDLAVLANDSGSILLVCESCKRQWLLEGAERADVETRLEAESVIDSLRRNPEVLEGTSLRFEDVLRRWKAR
jgi:hypothetical protein